MGRVSSDLPLPLPIFILKQTSLSLSPFSRSSPSPPMKLSVFTLSPSSTQTKPKKKKEKKLSSSLPCRRPEKKKELTLVPSLSQKLRVDCKMKAPNFSINPSIMPNPVVFEASEAHGEDETRSEKGLGVLHHPRNQQDRESGKDGESGQEDDYILSNPYHLISNLLDCTTWTGVGPGLMDAATKGALQANKSVGGFKIGKEANEWTSMNFHPYLPSETYLTCRFFSARKHGLVDAAVRATVGDRTAIIARLSGIGTLDEMFEILALIQLERIGSKLPIPFIVMNYDSFYSKLLAFLDDCEDWGIVSKGEVASLWKVCNGNDDALEYSAVFYNIHLRERKHEAALGSECRTRPCT